MQFLEHVLPLWLATEIQMISRYVKHFDQNSEGPDVFCTVALRRPEPPPYDNTKCIKPSRLSLKGFDIPSDHSNLIIQTER